MSDPYIGEIRMFAGTFAPSGWAFCAGQLLPISENDTLFTLIGTTYGGDGQETFALPDLRGRVPLHVGNGFIQGQQAGSEQVTLTVQQIPIHNHALLASLNIASASSVANTVTGQVGSIQIYREIAPSVPLSPLAIGAAGGSQPHSNFQPYLCINFIISLFGVYPQPA